MLSVDGSATTVPSNIAGNTARCGCPLRKCSWHCTVAHETTLSCTTCCVQHVSSCGRGNCLKISHARHQGKLCTTWKKVATCSTLLRQILSLELKQPITQPI